MRKLKRFIALPFPTKQALREPCCGVCALPRTNENKSAFPHLFSLWDNSHFPIPLCAIRKIKFAYSVKTVFAKTVLLTWYFISKQVWHKILSIILLRHKGGIFIAIYHCSIKIISRCKGKSAVAAAAYRSGEKLKNNYDGITHDWKIDFLFPTGSTRF